MQLTFLGTGASEGYPAPFCICANCTEARRRGGRDLRLRSSLLVNDDLLVDYNDLVAASMMYGVDVTRVETLLITHRHVDHWQPEQLFIRAYPFTRTEIPMMRLYGPHDALEMLSKRPERTPAAMRFEPHVVKPGDVWTSGPYTIRAFHATHNTAEPLLYAIDDGERSLLYSTDTGLYASETWDLIRRGSYDVVVMDETMGTVPTTATSGHLAIDAVLDYRAQFERCGLLRPGAQFIAHHFSHGFNPGYQELTDLFAPHGIQVAYDGWRLEV